MAELPRRSFLVNLGLLPFTIRGLSSSVPIQKPNEMPVAVDTESPSPGVATGGWVTITVNGVPCRFPVVP